MRYTVISAVCVAFVAVAVTAFGGNADSLAGPQDGGHGKHTAPGMSGMMHETPSDMMRRCRMMMRTAIDADDPAALLAQRDELGLTAEQVDKLQAIASKARQAARAVLDQAQLKQIAKIPAKPQTSMGMHEHMMRMMQGDQPGGAPAPMNCPMMNMMMGGHAMSGAGPTTQPTKDKTANDGHETHHH